MGCVTTHSHHAARTPSLPLCMTVLFVDALHGSLYNSPHPPEMKIHPPKAACGCPSGGLIKWGGGGGGGLF